MYLSESDSNVKLKTEETVVLLWQRQAVSRPDFSKHCLVSGVLNAVHSITNGN